jgi:hypothetical protein
MAKIEKTKGQKAAEAESKKDPKRAHVRAALKRLHPFLNEEFRTLKEDELDSEKVFAELFKGAKKIELYKLKAIYEFQK